MHYGENLGDEPVVLLAATLLETGAPAAIATNPERHAGAVATGEESDAWFRIAPYHSQ
ncbi:MAG: hypothetical protein R2845_13115 [Thermomicrobiales bacterium]